MRRLKNNIEYCCDTLKVSDACGIRINAEFRLKPIPVYDRQMYPAVWPDDTLQGLRQLPGTVVVIAPNLGPPEKARESDGGKVAIVMGHNHTLGISIWLEDDGGNVLSHELGHKAGISHNLKDPRNLMYQGKSNRSPQARPDCNWCQAIADMANQ